MTNKTITMSRELAPKLVCGIGLNDVGRVGQYENGKRIGKCPFYARWNHMLNRCYGKIYQVDRPSYQGCTVCSEWLTFSNFKAWMAAQDWQGKDLDKDILSPGNRIYSPDHCAFVDKSVNSFVLDGGRVAAGSLVGASWHAKTGKFRAYCWDVTSKKRKAIGAYDTAEESHSAWRAFKAEQAKVLAAQQPDHRIAAALIKRFSNHAA